MNSKYSNQDLINATFEIYNEFKSNHTKGKTKISEKYNSKARAFAFV